MKLVLISIIIFVVMLIVTKCIVASMSFTEKLVFDLTKEAPKRCIVVSWLLILSFIETVISIVIFIAKL